jgi:hypothetical protein
MQYPTINKVLASQEAFNSTVELEVTEYEMTRNEKFEVNIFPYGETKIEWVVHEDWGKSGLETLSAEIKSKKVELGYEIEDYSEVDPEDLSAKPKLTEDTIELDLPGTIEVEYNRSDSSARGPQLIITHLDIMLAGKQEDPKTWKITKAVAHFSI